MKEVIMDIKVLKLVTGEEILGEVVENIDSHITLKNPVGIAVVRGQDGQPNIGFAPFPLHAEPKSGLTHKFRWDHVIYSYEPAGDFKSNYDQIFGTGLITPPKKLIVG